MYALIAFLNTLLSRKSQKGQDLAEYALLIGLIAIVLVAAVTLLGTEIDRVFDAIGTALQTVGVGGGG